MHPVYPFHIRIYGRLSFGWINLLSEVVHPFGQWRATHALARSDILADPPANFAPARRLPGLERTLVPAETPAHGKIEVACIVGNLIEMNSAIMEQVTKYRPQKLC